MKTREKIDMYSFEKEAKANGYNIICGVDEAGRGPLAGPVCAAAVILPDGIEIEGLNDSKKLSEKKREELFPIICDKALAYCIAFATVEEIEEYNILNATMMAMSKAVKGIAITPDIVFVDGNKSPKIDIPAKTIIKGDALSASIAAASVLAKVSRDRLLYEYDEKYPQYGFAKHKGYGTAEHIEAIKKHGASEVHRISFIRKFLA